MYNSEKRRARYLRKKEQCLAQAKVWAKKNPERVAYLYQRANAKRRGVPFLLTFDEWFEWWGNDLPHRGQGIGKLQMCRYKDKGSYELGNIYKATGEDNTRHYYEQEYPNPNH